MSLSKSDSVFVQIAGPAVSATEATLRGKLAAFLNNSRDMKTMPRPNSRRVLRWIFQRGNHLLTCQLTKAVSSGRYILSLVPHWDREHGDSETFDSGLGALHRHAVIAKTLRDSGWKVVAYTGPSPFTPDYESVLVNRAA